LILLLGVLFARPVLAQTPAELEQNFSKPPDSARPWVYWFWLNGNITKEGITADLEAMKRVGVGGVLIMEVDQGAPVGPMDFMGPQWRELFKHVVAEAGRLGLEVNMNNDAGWNGSGGPWIKPEESMQKVVTADVDVEGPRKFEDQLPRRRWWRIITAIWPCWHFRHPGRFASATFRSRRGSTPAGRGRRQKPHSARTCSSSARRSWT